MGEKLIDKSSFAYKLTQLVYKAVVEVVGKRAVKPEDVILEHPVLAEHGDYSTNVAMKIKSRRVKEQESKRGEAGSGSPVELANQIVNTFRSAGMPGEIEKIEVAPPGFINFWLSNDYFISQLEKVLNEKEKFGNSLVWAGKKILLEHTSPNPQTTIMLGHLRNNFLGMSVANLLESQGAKVKKDCIVNDRGVHICRSIWGYLVFAKKNSGLGLKELKSFREITDQQIKKLIAKIDWQATLQAWSKKKTNWLTWKDLKLKPDHTNLIWYVLGSRAYELSVEVQVEVEEILKAWEAEDKDVRTIWEQIMDWSGKGYSLTYKRVGSMHDWVWYESDNWKKGREVVEEGLRKGVFRKSEGAIVTNLEKYGLSDTVVVKSDGTSLYLTQDLPLVRLKMKKFPSDLYIWDIGMEQTLYFQQLFALCEGLGIGKRDKFFHLSYALINFKGGGKMATRKGDVVMADDILDLLKSRSLEIIKTSNQELRGKLTARQLDSLAETVAVGAVKYSLLKFGRETTIFFDIDESLSLEGDAGPYLQYTYARCQSVLKKSPNTPNFPNFPNFQFNPEELFLLRALYRFPEIVMSAAENYSPSLVCNFLFDLAQKYNNFYNLHRIIGSGESEGFRLALTAATGQVIKNGLRLLGINTPERM